MSKHQEDGNLSMQKHYKILLGGSPCTYWSIGQSLDKREIEPGGLGCKIDRYVSYEIDKYAIQTTQENFKNTEQRGDAFQVRQENWKY